MDSTTQHLEDALTVLDLQLQEVSTHLLAADPLALERSSESLREAMAGFAQALAHAQRSAGAEPHALEQRLKDVGLRLAAQREGLARLAAATERQAEVLLPAAADQSTYTQAVGVRSASGAVARIYRSAS